MTIHRITYTRNEYPQRFVVDMFDRATAADAEDALFESMELRGIDIRAIHSTVLI